jgi:hypothetical protein
LMQQGIRRTKRRPVRMTWTLLLKNMTPSEFVGRYRLSREQFDSLLQRILAKRPKYKGMKGALDCRLKLASCLRYLAGGKAKDVADLHGQRESIFYKHLDETVDAILATETRTMRLPVYPWQRQQLEALKARCAAGHYESYVRGVFGFIDGIVVPTLKPKVSDVGEHVRDYWCERKKTWGINAVGVCNERLEFDAFIVRSGASTHDSTVVGSSWLGEALISGRLPPRTWLFGDGAFGGKPHILSPYRRPKAGTGQDVFNYVLSHYRQRIERAFGLLVRRWGILWSPLSRSAAANTRMLMCCVCLHNICQRDSSPLDIKGDADVLHRVTDDAEVVDRFMGAFDCEFNRVRRCEQTRAERDVVALLEPPWRRRST